MLASPSLVRSLLPGAAVVGLAAATSFTPQLAEACGGTFCDNTGGIPMPVDQRGEDILFIQDGPTVEVHVRIEYTGEAERFAWIVPLQALPEVSVGSDPLFSQLAASSAVRWKADYEYECPEDDPFSDDGLSFVPDSDFAGSGEDPDIVLDETVGSFDVVVLQGGTAAELIDFLDANDYAQDPAAEPIIQEYLDEGFLFAAVKLTANADVDAIHPLVFRFPGDEPCVPIRLTRIAAEEDMPIRAYFLGSHRWAPRNYSHVVLNTLGLEWTRAKNVGAGRNRYFERLVLAVDEAGGRAFATDYAGPSNVVQQIGVFSDGWDETAFIDVDPITAIDLVAQQGLNTHPLIQGLLMQFIPPPEGISPTQFWNNIEAFADQIDLDAWDGVAFAAALSERIIEPGLHSVDLLDAWPYLTRLHTAMSPNEMLLDPTFHEVPALGLVDNEVNATGLDLCGAAGERFVVPWEGQQVPVCIDEQVDNEWPLIDMPAAQRIEKLLMVGPPQVIQDNSQTIVAAWQAHQQTTSCASDPGGTDDGTDDDGTTDAGGSADEAGGEDTGADTSKAGCACSSDPEQRDGLALGLLALFGLALGARTPRVRRRR